MYISPDQSQFTGALLENLQRQLEDQFPRQGRHIFVTTMLVAASALFSRLEDDDGLAEIMNACLQGQDVPFRLVRTS